MEYRLKSGKTICRSYVVDRDLYENAARELMKDEEYRRRYYPILSWDEEKLEQINYVWLLLPKEFRESLEETGQDDGDAPVTGDAGGLPPGIEIAAEDAEHYDAELYDAELTMGYADAMVGMTLSRAQSIRLIRAYQEDLMQSDGVIFGGESVGSISINWRDQRDDIFQEQYMLCGDFTRTIEVLREAVAEDDGTDTES